jgi:hypothetical protein
MACPGSLAVEASYPDTSSAFAEEGTLAHAVAADCLENEHDAAFHVGDVFEYIDHGEGKSAVIDAEMARHVQTYVDDVRRYAYGHQLLVEQRLPIFAGQIPDQFGTGDAVVLAESIRELQLHDLKYGKGVQVFAERNEQLMLYGLGALDQYEMLGDFDQVRLVIHQPRLNHLDEWVVSVAELREFEQRAVAAGREALACVGASLKDLKTSDLNPGDDQCRFCKAKGGCPALRDKVLLGVAGDFEVAPDMPFTRLSMPSGDKELLESMKVTMLPPATVIDNLIELGKGEIAVSITEAEKIIAAAHGVVPKAVDFDEGEPAGPTGGPFPAHFTVKKPSIVPAIAQATDQLPGLPDVHLAVCMDAVDLIEGWCKATRAEVERRLLAGAAVPGWKLVQGKQGNRTWADPVEAEATLKKFRLKVEEMYDLTLISPTSAEKLAVQEVDGKPLIGPRQWKSLQEQIRRSDGKPSVAPAADKRPALTITAVADDFDEV